MKQANSEKTGSHLGGSYFGELLMYRHLCWNLVGADLRTRFRRSHLGILWAIIQPLAFSLIIAGVWGVIFAVDDYWKFALYVFTGITLWDFFATVVVGSQDALANAEGYLRQTRIPFAIFQVRTPLTSMVILLCTLVGLLGLQISLQRFPPISPALLMIVPFLCLFLLFGMAVAMVFSILGTKFRDLKHISSIVVQGLFFLSPVMFDRSMLTHPDLQFLQFANPMVPFLDIFRATILDGEWWNPVQVLTLLAWTTAMWVFALFLSVTSGRRLIYAI